MSGHSMPVPIHLTASATRKVLQLMDDGKNPALKLRVFVSGGGCSGFQYGFSFDEASGEGDYQIESDGAELIVDPMSYQYLMGAEVDYQESFAGAQFVVNNPNAATTCSCGSSFSI